MGPPQIRSGIGSGFRNPVYGLSMLVTAAAVTVLTKDSDITVHSQPVKLLRVRSF